MTLEQRLVAAIAAKNETVIWAMLHGMFGEDAKQWLEREMLRWTPPTLH